MTHIKNSLILTKEKFPFNIFVSKGLDKIENDQITLVSFRLQFTDTDQQIPTRLDKSW